MVLKLFYVRLLWS